MNVSLITDAFEMRQAKRALFEARPLDFSLNGEAFHHGLVVAVKSAEDAHSWEVRFVPKTPPHVIVTRARGCLKTKFDGLASISSS